jgi:hypothetical protein
LIDIAIDVIPVILTTNLVPFFYAAPDKFFETYIPSPKMPIPRIGIHTVATNPSESGFPTPGTRVPDKQDAWSASNNLTTKTPAEISMNRESARNINDREAEILEEKVRELLGSEGGTVVEAGGQGGIAKMDKHLSEREWREQEAELGQGGKEAPATQSY